LLLLLVAVVVCVGVVINIMNVLQLPPSNLLF
jgi:hypothetical protein